MKSSTLYQTDCAKETYSWRLSVGCAHFPALKLMDYDLTHRDRGFGAKNLIEMQMSHQTLEHSRFLQDKAASKMVKTHARFTSIA